MDNLLEKIAKRSGKKRREVIYGVYDNKGESLFVKINDFFIDHSKVSIKEKSYFFHMLAVMVDAGIPVVHALASYAKRTQNERFARVLSTIAYNSEHGFTLSDAMSRFPDIFTEVEVGVIKSGEAVGKLGDMLFRLSDEVGRSHELRMKLWSAAFYPMAVFVTLLIVAVAMLVFVFPTLINLLTQGGISYEKLPLMTRVLITAHTVVVDYWWALIGGALLFMDCSKSM